MSEVFTDRLSSGGTKVTFPLTTLNAKSGSACLFVMCVCVCVCVCPFLDNEGSICRTGRILNM